MSIFQMLWNILKILMKDKLLLIISLVHIPQGLKMKPKIANLYYIDARSDKVYNVELVQNASEGWDLNISYGRKGSSLQSSTKLEGVEYPKARKAFDKLVTAKLGKGYMPTGEEMSVPVTDKVQTGMFPQLANSLAWEDIEALWGVWDEMFFQEKYDGERRMIKLGTPIVASNRTGFAVTVHPRIQKDLEELALVFPDWILDCEDMGEYLWVFDIYHRTAPFKTRRRRLMVLEDYIFSHALAAIDVDTALHIPDLEYLRTLRDNHRTGGAEGIILRHATSPYVPGKPNSGGDLIRFKFWESATVIVTKQNDARSVQVAVADDIIVGNVSIPLNHNVPRVGEFVEVEYLYAYPNGGSLYQPVYKGPRRDKTEADRHSSLKFKRE
jgi:bifunctional non-homologous end joining protein LigD